MRILVLAMVAIGCESQAPYQPRCEITGNVDGRDVHWAEPNDDCLIGVYDNYGLYLAMPLDNGVELFMPFGPPGERQSLSDDATVSTPLACPSWASDSSYMWLELGDRMRVRIDYRCASVISDASVLVSVRNPTASHP